MAFFDVWRAENRRRDTGESQKESSVENDRKSTCRLDRIGDRSFGENRVGAGRFCCTSPGVARRGGCRTVGPGGQPAEDKGQQTADLLHRARQAMAENDLAAADSLISQAEALGCSTTSSTWATRRRRRGATWNGNAMRRRTPTKPSQLFAPLGLSKSKKVPASDPFAGRAARFGRRPEPQVTPLPKVDGQPGPLAVGRRARLNAARPWTSLIG